MVKHAVVAVVGFVALAALVGCGGPGGGAAATFGGDVAFLKQHIKDVIVLADKSGSAEVAVVPLYQGRVMTSTAGGPEGLSYGWINRKLIASGERLKGMNPFGGEDRLWFGPEGGQFSVFFKKGAPFDMKNWNTPEAIDWGAWETVAKTSDSATFRKQFTLVNFSDTRFDVLAERTVRLLGPADIQKNFGVDPGPNVKAVAYESDNRITNKGDKAWEKATGLLSIWILCMYNPSPTTVIVVPFVQGPEEKLGRIVNDAYFGKVPPERLVIRNNAIFFCADGKKRGKIGVGPFRARPILGSYDAANHVLTLAQYTRPDGAMDYVNSMWEVQQNPFAGDVVNSYNDGPNETGGMLGPFYELESSSPAAALQPGQTMEHIHRTVHIQGPEPELDRIARATLGVGLDEIKNAFK